MVGTAGKTRPPAPASEPLRHQPSWSPMMVPEDFPSRLQECWAPTGGDTAWRLQGTPKTCSPHGAVCTLGLPAFQIRNLLACISVFTSVLLGRIQESIRVSGLRAQISVTLEIAFVPLAACLVCGSGPILVTFLERSHKSHIRWKKFTDRHGDQGCLWQKEFPTSDDRMKPGHVGGPAFPGSLSKMLGKIFRF